MIKPPVFVQFALSSGTEHVGLRWLEAALIADGTLHSSSISS